MMLSTQHTQVLLWLARFKYLTVSQIHEHLFNGKTRRNTEIALQRIEKKGLIKRLKLARSQNLNFGHLCYLSKQGLDLIINEQQLDNRKYAKYLVKKPFSSINHYYHRYQLVNFWIKLDKDIRQLKAVELKTVLTESGTKEMGKKNIIETKLFYGKTTIIPDMIFVLRNTKTSKEAVFMVEIDSGKEAIGGEFVTIPKNSLLYKYKIYEKFLQSTDWQKQIGTTAASFQVLTVTEKQTHLKTLIKRIAKNMDYPERFLGSTFDKTEKGNLFVGNVWLTSSDSFFTGLL